ncbi:hypothetical protein K469DRAFT_739956 [Zopfia rhizophila CBS 207.26]|uniref:DUF7726 domain-containing protein n=1 Tax=Zopfia rhizophila CBS 207.26 TaxID=1314779 RepID=A0A6A6DTZ4_9PEZI|nr:hypothetical protein K469DRAFT_739956 [Zopfia rhizophila CBS 207.26]
MPKRKSDQHAEVDDEDLEYELENMPVTDSCDAIRRKIRAFIDSGEMKVGEFQNAIGVNSRSYSAFMGQNGAYKGSGSSVYYKAWAFFKKRELRGIKMPKKKAKTGDGAVDKILSDKVDVSSVTLDGEGQDNVEVYDTCDEIRRKINAHLQQPGVTQAQFLRDIAAQYHTRERKIQSKQLNDFRSKKGPDAGNTSVVYYGAYVFFEKMRIKEGKPKTKTREEMERVWGHDGGMDTQEGSWRKGWLVMNGDSIVQDRYGKISVVSGNR